MVNSNMANDTYTLTLDPDGGFIDHGQSKYTTEPMTLDVTLNKAVSNLPSNGSIVRPGYDF